VAYSSGG